MSDHAPLEDDSVAASGRARQREVEAHVLGVRQPIGQTIRGREKRLELRQALLKPDETTAEDVAEVRQGDGAVVGSIWPVRSGAMARSRGRKYDGLLRTIRFIAWMRVAAQMFAMRRST